MVLTEKQRRDLHVAVLEYFRDDAGRFGKSAEAFAAEAGLEGETLPGKRALEKKWTTIVRLQRRVLELEAELEQARKQMSSGGRPPREGNARLWPSEPAAQVLQGHRQPVTAVAFHPVYSLVATASEDATVRVYDADSGAYERQLRGHTMAVQALAFAPNGELLASASADLAIKLWDCSENADFECLKTLRGHEHTVSALVFLPAPEGPPVLVSGSRDETIKLWDTKTGFSITSLRTGGGQGWVRCLDVAPGGTIIAAGSNSHQILLWDTKREAVAQTLVGHEHVVEAVSFAGGLLPPGLLAAGEGGEELKDGLAGESDGPGAGGPLHLVSGSRDGTLRVWRADEGACLFVLRGHDNWVRGVAWHPNLKAVLSCGDDRTLRVYDLKSKRCARTITGAHEHFVTSLAMHRTLPLLATGGVDRASRIWNLS